MPIVDLVNALDGNYVGKVRKGVSPGNQDIDDPVRIEYIPTKPALAELWKMAVNYFFRGKKSLLSNDIYPAEAVMEINNPAPDKENRMDEICVLVENIRGEAHLRDQILEEFDSSLSEEIQKRNESKKELDRKEVNQKEDEQKERMDNDDRGRRGRGPSRGGGRRKNRDESIDDLFK
jgi:hypothetical protein